MDEWINLAHSEACQVELRPCGTKLRAGQEFFFFEKWQARNFAAMMHEHEAPRLFVIRGHAALVTQSRKAAERHFEH